MSTTLFYGPVISPVSLTTYKALPRCLLAVGTSGNIEWIVDEVPGHVLQETLAAKSCVDADIIELRAGEFLLPGFIDTHTVSRPSQLNRVSLRLTFHVACGTIPKHWKVHFPLLSARLIVLKTPKWSAIRTTRLAE
jgi:hypothetical protein